MQSLSPNFKSWIGTASCALGLGLALYLSLLKLFALPCVGPGNCHAVVFSAYGSVFGVPVGIFGALLWIGAILVPDVTKRGALLGLLAAGSAVFMIIQFAVLRSFCLYCTVHALAAWLALAFHRNARWWSIILAFALAAGGFSLTRHYTAHRAETDLSQAPRLAALPDDPSGLQWLGPIGPRSPALVLSLDCAACLDLIQELTIQSYSGRNTGPAVYFKINDMNRSLTTEVVAAVMSQRDITRREAFLNVAAVLLSDSDLTRSGPNAAEQKIASVFSSSGPRRSEADQLLAAQARALEKAGVGETTPLLIPRSGRTSVFFDLNQLFPQ